MKKVVTLAFFLLFILSISVYYSYQFGMERGEKLGYNRSLDTIISQIEKVKAQHGSAYQIRMIKSQKVELIYIVPETK